MKPIVLAFDLDHTLFEAQIEKNEKSALSSSAGAYISTASRGMILRPVLKTDSITNEEHRAEKVQAINQTEMSEIFRKIQFAHDMAKEQNVTCPLAVKIITSSTYDKKHIFKLLDEFYFFGLPILENKNRLPTEYYNYHDLEDITAIPSLPNLPTKSGITDPRKERLISKMYPIWARQLPNLEKERVVLIDNADYNIAAVANKGFTGLHYPTTPEDRLDGITYTVQGKKCLNELHRLIDEVTTSIQSISHEKSTWTIVQVSTMKFIFKRPKENS